MEDGPEGAEGTYTYAGGQFRLSELESERWIVSSDDGTRLGVLVALDGQDRDGPQYFVEKFGDERRLNIDPISDWRRALEYLIDNTAPPIGG
jgi:hypothetical protein